MASVKKRKRKPATWKTCKHQFPAQYETVREGMFGVAMGSRRVCAECGAIEYEDWGETRASGGVVRIYPPADRGRAIN